MEIPAIVYSFQMLDYEHMCVLHLGPLQLYTIFRGERELYGHVSSQYEPYSG